MPDHRRVDLPPFSFWETRAGSGAPVVLIHGLGGSADWWRHNIDVLAERYLVSAVDLVGFGRNRLFLRHSKLPLEFDDIAALLARWIESSFDEPVHLAGNSMGGHIAIHVAATRPDLVRSLVLVDATGVPFELAPGAHIDSLAVPRGWRSLGLIIARDLFRAGPTAFALAFLRLLRDDARPLLSKLTMPVLLLWGERDPLVPLTYARQMQQLIPNAILRVVPSAGHVPMWENPRAFNDELLRFLGAIEAAREPSSRPAFSWGLCGWTDGIAHRAAGRGRDVVLVHGLGMSSAYFARFAAALYERGLDAIAPDLPGFGASVNRPAGSPEEHAAILAGWADAVGVRDAIWVGHSLGCHAVAALARSRPDLVRRAVAIGATWGNRHPSRLLAALLIDAFREPFALVPYVVRAYLRCGLRRWLGTFRRYVADIRRDPPDGVTLVAGRRDPLVARHRIPHLVDVPGAHACHFAHPAECADAVQEIPRRLRGSE